VGSNPYGVVGTFHRLKTPTPIMAQTEISTSVISCGGGEGVKAAGV
jgi:hypothetical protein